MENKTEWVIYKPTGEIKVIIELETGPEGEHYLLNDIGYVLKSDCIPCPEPLPEGPYAVRACMHDDDFDENFWNDFLTGKNYEGDGDIDTHLIFFPDGRIVGCDQWDDKKIGHPASDDTPVIAFDRWYFWEIGPGKEYAGKVEKAVDPEEQTPFKEAIEYTELPENVNRWSNNNDEFGDIVQAFMAGYNKAASQPDYRTLYQQAQKDGDWYKDAYNKMTKKCIKTEALLEAAEAAIEKLSLRMPSNIPIDEYFKYQQLKAKHNG